MTTKTKKTRPARKTAKAKRDEADARRFIAELTPEQRASWIRHVARLRREPHD